MGLCVLILALSFVARVLSNDLSRHWTNFAVLVDDCQFMRVAWGYFFSDSDKPILRVSKGCIICVAVIIDALRWAQDFLSLLRYALLES